MRPARCAKSSTAGVARGSARIIQRRGFAELPIGAAANERVRRGLAARWLGRGQPVLKGRLSAGNRGFESLSLQQRVCLTGAFHGCGRKGPAFAGKVSLDETGERDVL